jgi:signal peptidase
MSDAEDGTGDDGPSGLVGWAKWFWTTDEGAVLYVRDVVTSVGAVLLVGLLLFAISGIWPPMVAIESGSMEPNMEQGDLVFVVSEDRFVPDEAPTHEDESTGVVPADRAQEVDHTEFNRHGDVIVYRPDGSSERTPVIHRAMLWVEAGENWYDRADPDAIGNADDCETMQNCPAPHAGFITKGDNGATNANYDQIGRRTISAPVRPAWVVGTAELKVPYLGNVRLLFSQTTPAPAVERSTTGTSPSSRWSWGPSAVDEDRQRTTAAASTDRSAVDETRRRSPARGPRSFPPVRPAAAHSRAAATQRSARAVPTDAASATVPGSDSASSATVSMPPSRSRSA